MTEPSTPDDGAAQSTGEPEAETERARRWRLVLGKGSEPALGHIHGDDLAIDRTLEALYESDRSAGLGSSSPHVSRWLGDVRKYFPTTTVRVMEHDALERLKLKQMLTEPELLASLEPDVQLVATLLSLKSVIPARTKDTARQVVRKVVDQLEARVRDRMVQAVRGALARADRTRRPRAHEIDWHRTIRANLHTWRPDQRGLVAETLVGHTRRRAGLRDVILCVDQSGSMAQSVVYASIYGAVLASMRSLRTRMVVFDTAVVDLTAELSDPVDLLFGVQLGGGTDIDRALAWCEAAVERPAETTLVLISDLFDSGDRKKLLARVARLQESGVTVVVLLALSDEGSPAFDEKTAELLGALGIEAFGCTPEAFPELLARSLVRR
jgi:Mg-chelatase subunit ChlD